MYALPPPRNVWPAIGELEKERAKVMGLLLWKFNVGIQQLKQLTLELEEDVNRQHR